MEMIDLQSNDALKIKHREETEVDFYKFLPDTQYSKLKKLQLNVYLYLLRLFCANKLFPR